ncbi:MAG: hemolysin family protein [Opitutales bacterium]|nr:hemolysin family protein [Opitutales bacterium]
MIASSHLLLGEVAHSPDPAIQTYFIIAILFTLGVSGICSLLEAMILSTTTAEIENLKKNRIRRGQLLEKMRTEINQTISTILTVNTIANTLGGILVGGLAHELFGNMGMAIVSGMMTIAILFFSEIIPKNLGVAYRVSLHPVVVYPLYILMRIFQPVTWFFDLIVKKLIRIREEDGEANREIILLAERSAKEGQLSRSEVSMVANALTLDNVRISEIMTPRTVVTALDQSATLAEVLEKYRNIPFARMPVYADLSDNIVGLIRRRDILHGIAKDEDDKKVGDLIQDINFIPENVTAASALQNFLKTHQQLAAVVDEFGSFTGVVTMEDVIEHIIGREIFEKDDPAIDMRELARARHQLAKKRAENKPSA